MRLTKRKSGTSILSTRTTSTSRSTTSLASPLPPSYPLPSNASASAPASTSLIDVSTPQPKSKKKTINDAGESPFPPSSFPPYSGWTLGRPKSFSRNKGKSKKIDIDADVNAKQFDETLLSNDSDTQPQPPLDDFATPTFMSPAIECPPSENSITSTKQPLIATTPKIPHQAPITTAAIVSNEQHTLAPPRPPLTTKLSIASSVPSFESGSGESTYPLVTRADDGQPHRRIHHSPSISNKLTKRRPVSVMYDQLELQDIPSTSNHTPRQSHYRSASAGNAPPQFFPLLIEPPALGLPEGAAPPHNHEQTNYILGRNHSSSTASASSGLYPSTDESTTIVTPLEAQIISNQQTGKLDSWQNVLIPPQDLSRSSSTRSYTEGDDGSVVVKNNLFLTKSKDVSTSSHDTVTRSPFALEDYSARPGSPMAVSTTTSMPTVSTSSAATTRAQQLRISTSNLDLASNPVQQPNPLPEVEQSLPDSGKRRSVAFEESSHEVPNATARARRGSRARPPIVRGRSSSLGATSVMTTYSIGEVVTATNGVVTTARAVHLENQSGTVAQLVDELMGGSQSMQRAFQLDGRLDWTTADGSAGTRRDSSSSNPRRRSHTLSTRQAPPPPHLNSPSTHLRVPHSAPAPATPPPPVSSRESLAASTTPPNGGQDSRRPGIGRSNSLRKLWRTISGGSTFGQKKKRKQKSAPELGGDGLDLEPPPVPQMKKQETYGTNMKPRSLSKKTRIPMGTIDPMIPLVPSPKTYHYPELARKDPKISAEGTNEPSPSKKSKSHQASPLSPRSSPSPLPDDFHPSDSRPFMPVDETLGMASQWHSEPLPLGSASTHIGPSSRPTQKSFRITSLPVAASSSSAAGRSFLALSTPPLTAMMDNYFHDLHQRTSSDQHISSSSIRDQSRRQINLHEKAEIQSHEARRRYRQTLIEITDDHVFQQVLEDLSRLENDPRVRSALGGGLALRGRDRSPRRLKRSASHEQLELQQRNQEMGGMFVVREMLHGERRYGRLLARGVQMVKTIYESQKAVPPVPRLPNININVHDDPPPASTRPKIIEDGGRSPSANAISPSRLRRPRTAPPGVRQLQQAQSTPMTSQLDLPTIPIPNSTSNNDEIQNHLEILLGRMPKLLALSLNLSSQLEHDPNPYNAADSFLNMEDELTREISGWASQVGRLIAGGLGDTLTRMSFTSPQTQRQRQKHHRGRSEDRNNGEWFEPDDRLTFSDILISPIQRGLRYHLQFKDLASKTIPGSQTSQKVNQALQASIRLAEKCNETQGFDVDQLRRLEKRNSTSAGGKEQKEKVKKEKKVRPLTMVY